MNVGVHCAARASGIRANFTDMGSGAVDQGFYTWQGTVCLLTP